jgi:hypothetical protein
VGPIVVSTMKSRGSNRLPVLVAVAAATVRPMAFANTSLGSVQGAATARESPQIDSDAWIAVYRFTSHHPGQPKARNPKDPSSLKTYVKLNAAFHEHRSAVDDSCNDGREIPSRASLMGIRGGGSSGSGSSKPASHEVGSFCSFPF